MSAYACIQYLLHHAADIVVSIGPIAVVFASDEVQLAFQRPLERFSGSYEWRIVPPAFGIARAMIDSDNCGGAIEPIDRLLEPIGINLADDDAMEAAELLVGRIDGLSRRCVSERVRGDIARVGRMCRHDLTAYCQWVASELSVIIGVSGIHSTYGQGTERSVA